MQNWYKELGLAITVMDTEGKILEMNDKAVTTFAKWGGSALIGKSLFNCHNKTSQSKIHELLASDASNTYTRENAGKRKLIHQTPWYHEGKLAGLVEFSIELPIDMPHFVRE